MYLGFTWDQAAVCSGSAELPKKGWVWRSGCADSTGAVTGLALLELWQMQVWLGASTGGREGLRRAVSFILLCRLLGKDCLKAGPFHVASPIAVTFCTCSTTPARFRTGFPMLLCRQTGAQQTCGSAALCDPFLGDSSIRVPPCSPQQECCRIDFVLFLLPVTCEMLVLFQLQRNDVCVRKGKEAA